MAKDNAEEALEKVDNASLREAVAGNPSAPHDLLLELAKKDDSQFVLSTLGLIGATPDVFRALLENPHINPYLLGRSSNTFEGFGSE